MYYICYVKLKAFYKDICCGPKIVSHIFTPTNTSPLKLNIPNNLVTKHKLLKYYNMVGKRHGFLWFSLARKSSPEIVLMTFRWISKEEWKKYEQNLFKILSS